MSIFGSKYEDLNSRNRYIDDYLKSSREGNIIKGHCPEPSILPHKDIAAI